MVLNYPHITKSLSMEYIVPQCKAKNIKEHGQELKRRAKENK